MPSLYAACDFVLCRGGANTLFEVAALGKPALVVPLPKGNSRGDQIDNARYFEGLGVTKTLLQEDCVAYYAISKEANYKEAEALISSKAFALSMGNIKIMDLCYCPFGKKCANCDKKNEYRLTDENAREFPVRRYIDGRGACRFEVYNCADLIGEGVAGGGKLLDLSLVGDKKSAIAVQNDTEKQKSYFNKYTSGHYKRGVL